MFDSQFSSKKVILITLVQIMTNLNTRIECRPATSLSHMEGGVQRRGSKENCGARSLNLSPHHEHCYPIEIHNGHNRENMDPAGKEHKVLQHKLEIYRTEQV